MSITLNVVAALAFLMGISFTHAALLNGLELKNKAVEHLSPNWVETVSKDQAKKEKDYSLPSVFLFDKNS